MPIITQGGSKYFFSRILGILIFFGGVAGIVSIFGKFDILQTVNFVVLILSFIFIFFSTFNIRNKFIGALLFLLIVTFSTHFIPSFLITISESISDVGPWGIYLVILLVGLLIFLFNGKERTTFREDVRKTFSP